MSKTEKAAEVFPPLCTHLDSLVDELRRMIPQALTAFEVEAIHKARVTTRRLKAALELLDSAMDPEHAEPFAKLGRKLRRRLGPLRDIDVMLGHLDAIKPDGPHGRAVEWLRQHLTRERDRARAQSRSKVPAPQVLAKLGTWWAMRQDVIDADPKVPALLTRSLHLQLDAFAERAALDTERRQDPHELRIAGKNLRYTLELAQAQGFDVPAGVLRTFKRMQGHLGGWHDYVVLAERAMRASLEEDLALHDPAMQKRVLKLVDHALTVAQRQLDAFSRLWSSKGTELAESIRTILPVTQVAQPTVQPSGAEADSDSVPARTQGT